MNNNFIGRVWWIPQVPGKPFHVNVNSVMQAAFIMGTLADYDIFQYENNIKPDFANVGGLEIYNGLTGEWESWQDDETGIDDPLEFMEYIENQQAVISNDY